MNLGKNSLVKMTFNILNMQSNNCGISSNIQRCWKWQIDQLFTSKICIGTKYAVLILNRPIAQNQEFMTTLWNNALVRVTVDGGTTRWDTYVKEMPETLQKSIKNPDLITGDFDSIKQETLEKYTNCCKVKPLTINNNVIHTPDQDCTDFTKALIELHKHTQLRNIDLDHVIAVCQNSGRLDQILGNIQTLYLANKQLLLGTNTRLYMMTDDAVSWLLSPGNHEISIPEQTRQHKRAWCSLVPVGETCASVTTSGLKWNLNNQPLKFGELVSTSNTFDGALTVTVKCTNTLLWSMRIPNLLGP